MHCHVMTPHVIRLHVTLYSDHLTISALLPENFRRRVNAESVVKTRQTRRRGSSCNNQDRSSALYINFAAIVFD
jgi:hypothetical protein